VHVRDGAMMRAVLPYTARQFGRAIMMPNLKPPVVTTARAKTYRDEIMAALPAGADFTPLMTLYLTDATDPNDVEDGMKQGVVTAAKLYPANATTNSEHGISDIRKAYPVIERMQKIGMPLLMHGEVTQSDVDLFDREAVFIDKVMEPLRRDFPALKIVFEHITTAEAAAYVTENGGATLGATITAHHMVINRNEIFKGGIRPHYYCLPIAKREKHRQALVDAATSGNKSFFLGTDTAPHAQDAKECGCGCAGCFTAVNALEIYAQAFDDAGKLDNFEAFASRNGPAFYGLPLNKGTVTLTKGEPTGEIKPILTETGQKIVPFASPTPVRWRLT
jgi:dihydroorotase